MSSPLLYDEALRLINSVPASLDVETLPIESSLGRVVAHDVVARVPSPPFTNSAMDGLAIRHEDGLGPFAISGTIFARPTNASEVPAYSWGQCARVMTGAVLPDWADTVVPVEQTVTHDDGRVTITSLPSRGMHVRHAGEDFHLNDTVLAPGTRLTPERLMAACAVGVGQVTVRQLPTALIVATGDELQAPGTELRPGAIFNSSSLMLETSARSLGIAVVGPHTIGDDHDKAIQFFDSKLSSSQTAPTLILTTGAVSAGERDFIPAVARALGFDALFHKVAIRPGRPVFLARRDRVLWLGLPGNPISSAVGWHFFIRPLLARVAGIPCPSPIPVTLAVDVPKPDKLRCFYRARVSDGQATVLPRQGSGEFRASAISNAYVVLPESGTVCRAGTTVMATLVE